MSRIFGPMRQVGILVQDIEAAMAHWVSVCGIGPWFHVDRLSLDAFTYRGRRYDGLHLSLAFANSGEIQLELMQQRCTTPSIYRDFLAAGHEGMQHWSSWPDDYDHAYQDALTRGFHVVQEGRGPRGRMCYLDQEGHPGTVIELNEMTPVRRASYERIREAAIGWDGSDPIRRGLP